MITRISGTLSRILDDRVRLEVGPIEYELLVPDTVRFKLEGKVQQTICLHTKHYLEAGAMQSMIHPRLIGFETESELEFHELLCTVDKIGVKKALKAMSRPINEIASAIMREDVKYISKLPGMGATSAEKVISTLKKKVAIYSSEVETGAGASPRPFYDECFQGLINIGLSPNEARQNLEVIYSLKTQFTSVEQIMQLIFEKGDRI